MLLWYQCILIKNTVLSSCVIIIRECSNAFKRHKCWYITHNSKVKDAGPKLLSVGVFINLLNTDFQVYNLKFFLYLFCII